MTATTLEQPALQPSHRAQDLTLEDLALMDLPTLERCYAGGVAPRLSDLDGSPRGRMLTLRGPLGRGPLAAAIRRFAASERFFPWAGKDFSSLTEDSGRGINRIRLLGSRTWYPFTTRPDRSVLDHQPCLILDYDQPENPWFIRRIRDELRCVGPGLFLGPALMQVLGRYRTALFFAIQA